MVEIIYYVAAVVFICTIIFSLAYLILNLRPAAKPSQIVSLSGSNKSVILYGELVKIKDYETGNTVFTIKDASGTINGTGTGLNPTPGAVYVIKGVLKNEDGMSYVKISSITPQ